MCGFRVARPDIIPLAGSTSSRLFLSHENRLNSSPLLAFFFGWPAHSITCTCQFHMERVASGLSDMSTLRALAGACG